jgi:hypothetical protein
MGQDEVRGGRMPGAGKIAGFLFHPSRAFGEVLQEPFRESLRYYGILLSAATVLTVGVSVLTILSMEARYNTPYHIPLVPYSAFLAFWCLLAGTAGFGIAALVFHLLVSLCGGKKGLVRTVTVLLYAATPLLLSSFIIFALVQTNSPALVPVLVIVLLWSAALASTGLCIFHEISLVNAVLPFVLAIFLVIAAMAVFFVLAQLFADPCGVSCSHVIAATAACSGDGILVTYQGGVDAPMVVNLSVRIEGMDRSPPLGGTDGVLPVGSSATYPGPFSNRSNVIGTVFFIDGAQQVVLDTTVKCGSGTNGTWTGAIPPGVVLTPEVFCGGSRFDPAASGCCGDTVFPRDRSGCCGGTVYNRETSGCCNATPFLLNRSACCGGAVYNTGTTGCCNDTPFLLSQSACCGRNLYDPETTGCCSGRPYDYLTGDCCGYAIYAPDASYCCNHRVTTGNCNDAIGDIGVMGLRTTRAENGLPAVAGTVVNNGTVTYTTITLTAECYDANGTLIDTFEVKSVPGKYGVLKGGYMVQFGEVRDGGSWDFEVPARNPATKTIRIARVTASYGRGANDITELTELRLGSG